MNEKDLGFWGLGKLGDIGGSNEIKQVAAGPFFVLYYNSCVFDM